MPAVPESLKFVRSSLTVALYGALLFTFAPAAGRAAAGGPPPAMAAPLLHTVIVPELGVALDLPLSHTLSLGGERWYGHASLDGAAQVPDVTLYLRASGTVPGLVDELSRSHGLPFTAATVEGRYASDLYRIDVADTSGGANRSESPTGGPVYALVASGGLVILQAYEGFAWEWFDVVGASLRVVTFAR